MTEIVAASPIIGFLIIFIARVADVSLGVFRLLLLGRGYSKIAAVIGFFEVTIFIIALGSVFSGSELNAAKVIAYAGGFATGNLVGSYIEEKMAIGYVVIQIFPPKGCGGPLVERLRAENYGVTRIMGEGRTGPREILHVTAKRKNQRQILSIMNSVAPDMFFNISDARSIHGGVFPAKKHK